MIEIFANISDEVKQLAEFLWNNALSRENPIVAGEFLSSSVKLLENSLSEEEIEFIDFYIKMQMEKMKDESNNSIG